ncbi:hypothetical protein Tco_0933485 [Tanacetum coccineum]
MTLDIHNWLSSAHQEIHKIVKDEIFPIVNQVDARVQNFEIQFLKETTKFVRDFQSFAKEADESLAKHKALAQLFEKVSEQKDTTKGTSTNTKFANQSTDRKPSLQPLRNNFVVRQLNAFQSERKKFSKNPVPQKVDETNDLSKPVTSNSAPSSRESTVVNNERVIAPGIFRINPFKASRVDNFPITVSQPHVITKNDVNSKTIGFSPKDVKSTTRTRRPQPKRDKIPSESKSSCLPNKLEKIEENHRRSKERFASPKLSKPRSCLRWSPTGRLFDLKGKIIASSESESQSDCSKGDNACTSNPQELISRRFPNSIFSMTGGQNWFDTLLIPLLSEYKSKGKADHRENECDI